MSSNGWHKVRIATPRFSLDLVGRALALVRVAGDAAAADQALAVRLRVTRIVAVGMEL